jgi:hypothetical protein
MELDREALEAAYAAYLAHEYDDKTSLTYHEQDCICEAIAAYLRAMN